MQGGRVFSVWFIFLGSLHLLVQMITYCQALDISLKIGDLAEVETTLALGFMSGSTMDRSKWWQLGSSTLHPQAFLRFMVSGAPDAGVLPNSSWGHHDEEYVKKKGYLLATRDASLADFSSRKSIKELGNLNMDAWMLGFSCLDSSLCESIAPMAIVNRTNEATGSYCPEFTIVWDKLAIDNSVVANTITANLIPVSKEEFAIHIEAEGDLETFNLRVAKGMEPCTNTSMVAVRSSLYATYNLGPYACYHMNSTFESITGKEFLLVLGMQHSDDSTTYTVDQTPIGFGSEPRKQISSSPTRKCIKDWLQKHKSVELGKCQGSVPLLVHIGPDEDINDQEFFAACLDSSSKACWKLASTGPGQYCDDAISSALNSSRFTESQNFQNLVMNVSGPYHMRGESNYGLTTGNLCEMASMNGSSKQQEFNDDNPRAVETETLGMLFTGLKDRYAQAHSDAFQLQYGPSMDFPSTAIALVSATIAVLAATVPFTNFLLWLLINIFRRSLCECDSNHRYKKVALIFVMVFMVNEVLAIVSNATVLIAIMSEMKREEEFKTWALIAELVLVNASGLQLQALYVVQGKSTYKSQLLELLWVLGSTMILLVGGITMYRCRDVLKKLNLIEEKEGSRNDPLLDFDRALEMGNAGYMQLLASPSIINNPTTMPLNDPTDPPPTRKYTFKKMGNFVRATQAIQNVKKKL